MIVYPLGINETLPYLTSRMCDEMKPKLAHVHVVFVALFKNVVFPLSEFIYSTIFNLCFLCYSSVFHFCLNLILIPTVVSRFRQMFICSYIFLPFFCLSPKDTSIQRFGVCGRVCPCVLGEVKDSNCAMRHRN